MVKPGGKGRVPIFRSDTANSLHLHEHAVVECHLPRPPRDHRLRIVASGLCWFGLLPCWLFILLVRTFVI